MRRHSGLHNRFLSHFITLSRNGSFGFWIKVLYDYASSYGPKANEPKENLFPEAKIGSLGSSFKRLKCCSEAPCSVESSTITVGYANTFATSLAISSFIIFLGLEVGWEWEVPYFKLM